jgi:hypothetical protein
MNVSVNRSNPQELSFEFQMDPADACVPVPVVWFRLKGADKIGPLRISLMAYLLARPFIGNSFVLSGIPLPAHLASRLHQNFGAHEFFIGPVTNIPERILPDFQYEVLDVCASGEDDEPSGAERSLMCRRTELGYVLETMTGDLSVPLSIATNVDLYTAFTERPRLLSLVLIYLCSYDLLGIRSLRLPAAEDRQWWSGVGSLLAEVGASASFERDRLSA